MIILFYFKIEKGVLRTIQLFYGKRKHFYSNLYYLN